MFFLQRLLFSCLILSLAAGCASQAVDVSEPRSIPMIEPPSGAGSAAPNLSMDSEGQVLLSWIEPGTEDRDRLRFSVLEPHGVEWSSPETVAEGTDWFVNWADFPSLIPLPAGRLAAHWLAKTGPDTYAYAVNVALSDDGGRNWSDPITPHSDGTETEHGFVSMLPTADGSVSAVWLDGRQMAGPDGGDMSLMHALIRPDGSVQAETLLDDRICECCQTAAALIPGGQLVVYRDRSADEIRDISILSYRYGAWSKPRNLSKDGWEIYGCPVNGPSISASGEDVAVSWFTSANDEPAVWLVLSDDAGETFGSPIRIDDGRPLGRIEVLTLSSSVFVAWMEQTDDGVEVRLKQVDQGAVTGFWTVANTSEERSSGFPQLVGDSERLVLAWTETGNPSHLRTAIMSSRDYSN